ncbi:hypothetical protein F511_31272 [Dorcoceras hygrometricum]|uniref:Uncharacterized protein n=1 Tax=Dorcoceras hygrometricum TaxID=472368 RepID=A0A2Z7DET2_9LAMI|nr:hypothetical protein F511_31272 [Dorcoceras hygrometricum]
MGSNPSTESNYNTAVNSKDKMQILCMKNGTTAEGYNRRREPKDSNLAQRNLQRICGHGVCRTCGRYPLTPTRTPLPDASTAQPAVAQPMNCANKTDSIQHMQHQSYTEVHTTATSQFIQAITTLNYKLQIRTSVFCATITTNGVPRNLIHNLNEVTSIILKRCKTQNHTAGSYNSKQQLSYTSNSTGSLNKRSSWIRANTPTLEIHVSIAAASYQNATTEIPTADAITQRLIPSTTADIFPTSDSNT